jgi:hypothetical protein
MAAEDYEGYLENIVTLLADILDRLKKIEKSINQLPRELADRQ